MDAHSTLRNYPCLKITSSSKSKPLGSSRPGPDLPTRCLGSVMRLRPSPISVYHHVPPDVWSKRRSRQARSRTQGRTMGWLKLDYSTLDAVKQYLRMEHCPALHVAVLRFDMKPYISFLRCYLFQRAHQSVRSPAQCHSVGATQYFVLFEVLI